MSFASIGFSITFLGTSLVFEISLETSFGLIVPVLLISDCFCEFIEGTTTSEFVSSAVSTL